jgi:hypothetical protein
MCVWVDTKVWYTYFMCDCRVCLLESKYPDDIEGVIGKVFEYITEEL